MRELGPLVCFERARWSLRCAFPSTATCNGEPQSIRLISHGEDTIESQDGQEYTHKCRVLTDQQINTSTNPRNGFHHERSRAIPTVTYTVMTIQLVPTRMLTQRLFTVRLWRNRSSSYCTLACPFASILLRNRLESWLDESSACSPG